MNCQAACCLALSLDSTNSPEPEYVGFAGWVPNRGSAVVLSVNWPCAALRRLASSAVLVTYMPSLPALNRLVASVSEIFGWAPEFDRSPSMDRAPMAAGLSSCGAPDDDSSAPPLLLISDWV